MRIPKFVVTFCTAAQNTVGMTVVVKTKAYDKSCGNAACFERSL